MCNIVGDAYLIGCIDESGNVSEYFTGKKIPCKSQSSNVRFANAYDMINLEALTGEQRKTIANIVKANTFTTDLNLTMSEENLSRSRRK